MISAKASGESERRKRAAEAGGGSWRRKLAEAGGGSWRQKLAAEASGDDDMVDNGKIWHVACTIFCGFG